MNRRPPNLLLVTADQLRPDCLGFAERQPVSTPAIDALASSGVVFSNAFTHIPTCCPARQSLLHGSRPEAFGALWNYDIGLPVATIDPSGPTWVTAMKQRGIASCYVGKWHVHPHADPVDLGYDRYVSLDAYDDHRIRIGAPALSSMPWAGMLDPVDTADTRTHWMARQAVRWLEAVPDGQPWHLRVDFVEPHLPSCPTADFLAPYWSQDPDPWPNWDDPLAGKPHAQLQQRWNWGVEGWSWEDWKPLVAHYLATIAQLDDALREILAAIERRNEKDTLIVFTSDHGDLTGSHGMIDKHNVMYDEVLRVPLILRWPRRWSPRVDTRLVYGLLDLAATLYEIYEGVIPSRCHGQSLLGACDGTAEERDEIVATYNGQQFGLYTQRAIRTQRWKYVWNAADVDELYDLESDPAELVNRIADDSVASLVVDLRRRLYDVLTADADQQVANEWVRRQLVDGRKAPQSRPASVAR